jgi:cell division protein FtsI/penicillin-binding protein 2
MRPELLVRKRIWLMTIVLAGLFLLVIGRLATLTIRDAEALTQRGVSQWTKAGTVTAKRGRILDRKAVFFFVFTYRPAHLHALFKKL